MYKLINISLFISVLAVTSGCIVSKAKFEEAETKRLACEFRKNQVREELDSVRNTSTKKIKELEERIEFKDMSLESLITDTIRLSAKNKEYQKIVSAKISEKEKLALMLEDKSHELDQKDLELRRKSIELTRKDAEIQSREKIIDELSKLVDSQKSKSDQLLKKVQTALVNFDSDELTVNQKNGKIYIAMSDKLLFKSGSADVEKKGKEALGKLAEVLRKNPDIDIYIEGHTDSIDINTARFKDNWDLSVLRATSVVRLLTEKYNIDPKQLIPSGKGEHFPVASNKTPEGRAKNRRTEIVLSPNLDELFNLLQNNQ